MMPMCPLFAWSGVPRSLAPISGEALLLYNPNETGLLLAEIAAKKNIFLCNNFWEEVRQFES